MPKIFIAVGHGGRDPGAIANGLREADINLTMAIAAQEVLVRHGCTVLLSRVTDEYDPTEEEIREANAFAPDIAVAFHNNAGGGDGFEAYRQTNGYQDGSRHLAQCIEKEVKLIGQNSRGIKTRLNNAGTDYFGFLRQVKTAAVLLEGAFLDSSDRFIIDTVSEQQVFGIAYAKGMLACFGIPFSAQSGGIHAALEHENSALKATVKAQAALLQQFKALASKI